MGNQETGLYSRLPVIHPHSGTPQGGVISLILANIYLHYGVDLWFERSIKSPSTGKRLLRCISG